MTRRIPSSWLALGLVLSAACAPADKAEDTAPPINGGDTDEVDCEGAPPVVTALEIANGGMQEFDGVMRPTVYISVHAEDDDGDLHTMSADLHYDEVVDGSVDTTVEGIVGSAAQFDPQACSVGSGIYNMTITVGDARLAADTLYEFAAIAHDAHGLVSEPTLASGWMPTETGEDGGP